MNLAIIIFALTYLAIASEKVDRTVAAVLGAAAMLLFRIIPYGDALAKVDLNVLFLLIGMMIIVGILSLTGVFEWIAIVTAQKARGHGVVLLVQFLLVTALLSAFLDNVTTIILMAPITILITQILEIPTVPILILEAIFSNIGGTATLVGDPPNILIGSQANLHFNAFLANLGPVILIIAAGVLALVIPLIGRHMKTTPATRQRIMRARPELAITKPRLLARALPVFALVLVGFFTCHALELQPGIIALSGAFLMVFVTGVDVQEVMHHVAWPTILFFSGLFILVGALEANGVFDILALKLIDFTGANLLFTALGLLWFSALLSAFVDNIPLVIALIPLIKNVIPIFAEHMGIQGSSEAVRIQVAEPLYWALALGACLGGNGSLIGASANVVIAHIAHHNKYRMTFMGFTRWGFPLMIFTLLVSSAYIWLRYFH